MPKLRWVDDDKARNAVSNVVMKILREDKSLSYGDPKSDNILVHGDNLEALKALLPFYAGRVKCIYIDPPYNTGSIFENYDDNLENSIWLSIIYPRLALMRDFLTEDGAICVQIDARQMGNLRVIMDELYGSRNFVNAICCKAKVAGLSGEYQGKSLQDSTEYLFVYCKNSDSFEIAEIPVKKVELTQYIQRMKDEGRSWKYTSVLKCVDDGDYVKTLTDGAPLKVYKHRNFEICSVSRLANECYGGDEGKVYAECYKKIFRTTNAQTSIRTRFMDAVSASNDELYSIVYIPQKGRWAGVETRIYFKGDNLVAWLKEVVEEVDRKPYKIDSMGTLWDDVQYNNLTKEGGVKFPNGKKPELLVGRVIKMLSQPGDYVLDGFLGSGTTAATAHKLGRKWIGIERGAQCKTHCAKRLVNVITGNDDGGISKNVNWIGGGGFKFYELGEPLLDENGAISEGIDFDTLAAHIWWRETEKSWDVATRNGTFLGVHDGVAYAMLYNGVLHDRSYAGGNVLTPKTMRIIREDIGEAKHDRLIVYGECTKLSAAKLKEEKVEFRQTPYDIVTRR